MPSPRLHRNASVAVDLVVLTIWDGRLVVLAVRRGVGPFKGRWALPGGFVHSDEDLLDAAARELREETARGGWCDTRSALRAEAADPPLTSTFASGNRRELVGRPPKGGSHTSLLMPVRAHLEQLATYGEPGRDPRGRVVTVAYLALLPRLAAPSAGSDAAAASWRPVDEALAGLGNPLAFDHQQILADGVERARSKLEYSPLAIAFCEDEFTIAELRRVYEAVWGTSLDPRNFHRKVTGTPGFVVATGRTTRRDGGRPAQLFASGEAVLLHPAMLRGS